MQAALKRQQKAGRDNGRTPFHWDNTANAGFTTGVPWIKLAANSQTIHVAAQEKDPTSCLNYFRSLVKLRKENIPVLVYGKYTLLDKANPKVYAYTREAEGQRMLVMLNFTSGIAQATISFNLSTAKLLLSNYKEPPAFNKGASSLSLKPYQAAVYKL